MRRNDAYLAFIGAGGGRFGEEWKTNIARQYEKAYNRSKYNMLCGTKKMKQGVVEVSR